MILISLPKSFIQSSRKWFTKISAINLCHTSIKFMALVIVFSIKLVLLLKNTAFILISWFHKTHTCIIFSSSILEQLNRDKINNKDTITDIV